MEKGMLFYFVGRSGSGKTTISTAFVNELKKRGVNNLQLIDGDVIRKQFGGIFGYTYEERMKCNRVTRVVVQYLVDNGINVALSHVAAYREMRDNVRNQFSPNYTQIYVNCSLEECARRDVKGYYKAKIKNLNGLNDTYEDASESEVILDTEKNDCEHCVDKLIRYVEENNSKIFMKRDGLVD